MTSKEGEGSRVAKLGGDCKLGLEALKFEG